MRRIGVVVLLLVVALAALMPASAQAERPVVRAVMFWADGCPHCHTVLENVLPPLQAKYGDQLDLQLIEISSEASAAYFRQIEEQYKVPAELRGVPALFIGDRLLVGDQEIPGELPGLIEQHLQAGGVDYPNLPGLVAYLPAGARLATETSQPLAEIKFGTQAQPAPQEQAAGGNGFGLATAVMVGLGLALVYALAATVQAGRGASFPMTPEWADNLIPLLSVIGLGVAVYLTYVETQQVAAVCGPVGDCNAVQSSPYAYLFGVIPVGLLGAGGYVALLLAWTLGRFGRGVLAQMAPLALFGMALFGVLFCMYLTYLELAIIRAVCIWCLSVAVTMALILVLSVGSAMAVLAPAGDEEVEEAGQPG